MAPLPPNSTPRTYYDYTQGSTSHTFVVRSDIGATLADIDAGVNDWLDALSPLLVTTVVTAVRQSAAGSDLSFPAESALIGNSYGAGVGDPSAAAREMTFTGRSTGGRRAMIAIFGLNFVPIDYRITSVESADVGAALNALRADPDLFEAVDGISGVVWNGYANVSLNDYWVRKAR